MKFELTDEQIGFGEAITALLRSSDTVAVARSWADGDHAPGVALWGRLADLGLTALVAPEDDGGLGGTLVDLAVAFEVLGHELAVGPWIESAALVPQVEGAMVTAAVPGISAYAADAQVAQLLSGTAGATHASIDTTRTLTEVAGADAFSAEAVDRAVLACAAELLGAGERVLADSVTYVKQRKQFGREIGSYQAIKHQLADVRIALDFARPLVFGAALGEVPVSAAKVYAGDAAYLAARTGLQVHGAIGYTAEFDLSLWLNRIRALVTAWGTPAFHRGRVLEHLVGA
ncbi:acyl-CoA dehydrogenase [Nocardioides marmoriginsengisoli]|uniref:Acyl-CoA dehydrogenase n=1 Tax=Nocardioides marmoriginsengisoli TaxID=661483 RepID=A0A3N0C949_9ACTN|nr:acyl-CoA dehydrogenase family protein [Nocardioides marmoriginsengisoli]RNL59995.1 acyl-CoA dehydrogenase [Nocardioides marmoriginsengisoli]